MAPRARSSRRSQSSAKFSNENSTLSPAILLSRLYFNAGLIKNQSRLNDLSMFSQRRQTTLLAWSPSTQAAYDHATETVTNNGLAPYAATLRRVSRLGNAAGAHKVVPGQSISLIAIGLRYTGLAQPFIVAICAHIAAEGMHVPHECNGELRPYAHDFSEITLRLLFASQLP